MDSADLIIQGTNGKVEIGPSDTTISGGIVGNIVPKIPSAYNLGSSTAKWDEIWVVTPHIGDLEFGFGQGLIMTEPDKVYKNANVDDGVYFMTPDWMVAAFIGKDGTVKTRGKIETNFEFPEPDIPKKKNSEEETEK